MKLARQGAARTAATGALLGALGGRLFADLGLAIATGQSTIAMIFAGLLVGLVVGWLAALKWLLIADAVLLAAYTVIALTPLAAHWSAEWVRSDAVPAHADAIVVPSSGVTSDTTLDVQGLDRLIEGLTLIHAGVSDRLITTRAVATLGSQQLSTEIDERRMIALVGAPRWDVVDTVHTTRDEAERVARLLPPNGPGGSRLIVLVTSPMHTRRACATFEKVGLDVVCVPAREHDASRWHPRTPDERLAAFRSYLYERLAMVKYRFKHWV
jgi:uncharacterized SAM-binding protein YcdF (DUF218 family)